MGDIRGGVAGADDCTTAQDREQHVRDAADLGCAGNDTASGRIGAAGALDADGFRPTHCRGRAGSGDLLSTKIGERVERLKREPFSLPGILAKTYWALRDQQGAGACSESLGD